MNPIRLLNHLTNPTLYAVRAEAPTARANITIISFPLPPVPNEKRAA